MLFQPLSVVYCFGGRSGAKVNLFSVFGLGCRRRVTRAVNGTHACIKHRITHFIHSFVRWTLCKTNWTLKPTLQRDEFYELNKTADAFIRRMNGNFSVFIATCHLLSFVQPLSRQTSHFFWRFQSQGHWQLLAWLTVPVSIEWRYRNVGDGCAAWGRLDYDVMVRI